MNIDITGVGGADSVIADVNRDGVADAMVTGADGYGIIDAEQTVGDTSVGNDNAAVGINNDNGGQGVPHLSYPANDSSANIPYLPSRDVTGDSHGSRYAFPSTLEELEHRIQFQEFLNENFIEPRMRDLERDFASESRRLDYEAKERQILNEQWERDTARRCNMTVEQFRMEQAGYHQVFPHNPYMGGYTGDPNVFRDDVTGRIYKLESDHKLHELI